MKSEYLLAKALKEMMSTQSLDSISVIELSERCNVSRKTFYYHYHDVYDLLTQVFLDEKIPGSNETTDVKELIDLIWKYYQDNKAFLDATIQSAGKDLLFEFIYNIFYTSSLRFLDKYDDCKRLHMNAKKAIARFYAAGYSHSILYYLTNFKNKTYKGLCNCVFFINNENVEKTIEHAIAMEEI